MLARAGRTVDALEPGPPGVSQPVWLEPLLASVLWVVGVDRIGQAEALRSHGADLVVDDLGELLAP